MSLQALNLFIETQSGTFVKSATDATPITLRDFVQGDSMLVTVTHLVPTGLFAAPLSKLDFNGFALIMSLVGGEGKPTGTSGGPVIIASNAVWTWDSVGVRFSGTLNLNTAAVETFLGDLAVRQTTLEIAVTDTSGNHLTYIQTTVNLRAEVNETAATSPDPSVHYLTATETAAMYVKKVGLAGESFSLTSPDGTKNVLCYCGNDGAFHADPF